MIDLKEFNELFGWEEDFDPQEPEDIEAEIERLEADLEIAKVELSESRLWHQQHSAYYAIEKHVQGGRLSEEDLDALRGFGDE